jgi:hypothetical protein
MLITGRKGDRIALIVDTKEFQKGINFITDDIDPLQAGILAHPKGKHIQAHTHNPKAVGVVNFMEVLYIQSGNVTCTFYDIDGWELKVVEVQEGDLIVQINGGHEFMFDEDSRIIEVKQGAYTGREDDKKLI